MNYSVKPGNIIFIALCCLQFFLSCNVEKSLFPKETFLFLNQVNVKRSPPDTPFVFYNKINVTGNVPNSEKNKLTEDLAGYWNDSVFAARVRKFGFFYTLKNPPVFDSANLMTSIKFMSGYLFSQGYFNPLINDTFKIDSFYKAGRPPQLRTYVAINVNPQKQTIIDSFKYNINNHTLENIAYKNAKLSYIKPGKTAYSKQVIAAELDRLVVSFRINGYFLIKRDNFFAEVDTGNISLLQRTTDTAENAKTLAEAERKRLLNPVCTVIIKDRPITDSSIIETDTSAYTQFYVGNIFYFPETKQTDLPDSLIIDTASFKRWNNGKGFTMFYNAGLFKAKVLRAHTYMRKGVLYNEDRYYKTLNNFSQIGAWRQTDTRTVIRQDTVDFHFFLYPEKKQNITYNLEASRNTGDFLSSSNLFGLSFNITYRNRNLWKKAVQSSTSLRNGVELSFDQSNSILQSLQSSLTQTLSFPGLITPVKIKKEHSLEAARTIVNLNASYSERKDFFRLRSFVSNWGYEWKKKNIVWQYRPLNIELYSLDTLPLLDSAFQYNPFLRTSFNTGSVISQQLTFNHTYPGNDSRITNYLRISLEESGLLLGRIKSLQDKIYQYVKLEGEYRKSVTLKRNALALRALAGIGYNYGNDPRFGKTLPFFKQFIAGGPNSMRAWGLRLLGLGSSLASDTSSTFRDRYGDLQLEANIEYRYPLIHISSVDVKGALFADAGNIWNLRNNPNNEEGVFAFSRLGQDIAIAAGTGIRFDFNFFIIRVDLGFKLKDPTRIENNGWLDVANFTWRNHEYEKYNTDGILISPKRNNYAIQLGIGLPF